MTHAAPEARRITGATIARDPKMRPKRSSRPVIPAAIGTHAAVESYCIFAPIFAPMTIGARYRKKSKVKGMNSRTSLSIMWSMRTAIAGKRIVEPKDTDNRHIHIIANRISLYGEVYDTTFVSNRAARVAEEISREKGLTIAKEVKAERKHQKTKSNPTREQTKQQVQQICYALLDKYKGTGITGHSMFLYELNKNGISIGRMKNKQGKVYGLKFSYREHTFKASEIGREFGYRSLQKNFEPTNKEESRKPHQTVQEPTDKNKYPDTGYQLIPPSRSSISRDNDTPQVQNPIGAVADTIVSAADEVVEELGDLITPTTQGNDYAEAAWQRKLRNQANRKKKRGRGL